MTPGGTRTVDYKTKEPRTLGKSCRTETISIRRQRNPVNLSDSFSCITDSYMAWLEDGMRLKFCELLAEVFSFSYCPIVSALASSFTSLLANPLANPVAGSLALQKRGPGHSKTTPVKSFVASILTTRK